LLLSGYSWVFVLASCASRDVSPLFGWNPNRGLRAMFWIGIPPAVLLLLWIRVAVSESPIWLDRQKHLNRTQQRDPVSIVRILKRDMIGVTLHTSLLMGAFMFSYHSTSFWYP